MPVGCCGRAAAVCAAIRRPRAARLALIGALMLIGTPLVRMLGGGAAGPFGRTEGVGIRRGLELGGVDRPPNVRTRRAAPADMMRDRVALVLDDPAVLRPAPALTGIDDIGVVAMRHADIVDTASGKRGNPRSKGGRVRDVEFDPAFGAIGIAKARRTLRFGRRGTQGNDFGALGAIENDFFARRA